MNQINLIPADSQEQMRGKGEIMQREMKEANMDFFLLSQSFYIYIIADNVHNMSFTHYGAGVREGEGLAVCWLELCLSSSLISYLCDIAIAEFYSLE